MSAPERRFGAFRFSVFLFLVAFSFLPALRLSGLSGANLGAIYGLGLSVIAARNLGRSTPRPEVWEARCSDDLVLLVMIGTMVALGAGYGVGIEWLARVAL